MLWLGIYLPLLPLEVFEATATPVAICDDRQIVAANNSATQSGIEPGLAKSTALSLCDNLQLKQRDIQKEQSILEHLANLCYQFSNQVVAYSNQQQQHSLLLEIAGSLQLFGGQATLIHLIQQALSQTSIRKHGFSGSMTIASTCKAAEVTARYLTENERHQESPANDLPPTIALGDIPVTYLDTSRKTIQHCIDMGLSSIATVLDLPTAALRKRFNAEFTDYLQQLSGEQTDYPVFFVPPDSFRHELFFIDGLHSHSDLQHPVRQLLHALCRYLQQHQWRCLEIHWLFTRFSRKKHPLLLKFSEPQHQLEQLLTLTQLQLDQIPLDSPVECVQLTARKFSRMLQQNQDFFSHQNQRGNALFLADTLRGKLGEKSLYLFSQSPQLLPEEQSPQQETDFIKQVSHTSKKERANDIAPGNKPAWLFEPPKKLFKKNKTLYQGKFSVTLIRGPERIEANWWQNKKQRDYYIARLDNTNTQSMYAIGWVFYDRLDRQWYLHGLHA